MADDTDDKSGLSELDKREDFPGWKEPMKPYAMEKGDVEGIFTVVCAADGAELRSHFFFVSS